MRWQPFPLLLVFGACASDQPLARLPQVPLLDLQAAPVVVDWQSGARAAADRSSSPPVTEPAAVVIDPAPPGVVTAYAVPGGTGPVYRTVTRIVEYEAPAVERVYYEAHDGRAYYHRPDWRYHRYGREPWFPVNTALGAGLGAIIGHQSGRRDRGALIGGVWGLLLDLHRLGR